jgi:5-formyltetrahydrofolate cyclo-ligase
MENEKIGENGADRLKDAEDRSINSEKEQLRQLLLTENPLNLSRGKWSDKAAERLRRTLPLYQKASSILVSLSPFLHQVKINTLADNKRLFIPTPGLQKGFNQINPKNVPVQKRKLAIQPFKDNPFHKKVPYDKPFTDPIELIITDALAVGMDGSRLGDGHGHLDLQCAILSNLGWLSPTVRVIAIVDESQIRSSLPMEETDIGVHWIVTAGQVLETQHTGSIHRDVVWEKLSRKSIRRNEALFFLYRQLHPQNI